MSNLVKRNPNTSQGKYPTLFYSVLTLTIEQLDQKEGNLDENLKVKKVSGFKPRLRDRSKRKISKPYMGFYTEQMLDFSDEEYEKLKKKKSRRDGNSTNKFRFNTAKLLPSEILLKWKEWDCYKDSDKLKEKPTEYLLLIFLRLSPYFLLISIFKSPL